MSEIDILKIRTKDFIEEILNTYELLSRVKDLQNLRRERDSLMAIEVDYAVDQLNNVNPNQKLKYKNRLNKLLEGFFSEEELDQFKKNYDFDELNNEQIKRLKELITLVNDIDESRKHLSEFNKPERDFVDYRDSLEGWVKEAFKRLKALISKKESIPVEPIVINYEVLKAELISNIQARNQFYKSKWHSEFSRFKAETKTFFELKLAETNPRFFPLFKSIAHGDFVPDLHKEKNLGLLSTTISQIQLYQFLKDLLDHPNRLKQFKNSKDFVPIKPIVWNAGKEALGTLFADLKHNNIIKGTAEEIHDFILVNFVDAEGDSFSKTTLEDNFRKSSKFKKQKDGTTKEETPWDKNVRNLGHELMQHLKTDTPKKKKRG